MVRLPDAAGQVRNVPVRVLRGIFAGIGQLLLAADRFRAEEAAHEHPADAEQHDPLTPPARQPGGHVAPVGGKPPEQARFRSLDSTGNVRILPPGEKSGRSSPAARQPPRSRSAPAAPRPRQSQRAPAQGSQQPRRASSAPKSGKSRLATADAGASPTLPMPGYDGLSLPSLRSRLRNLDASQLRVLIDYEKTHAGRPDVVTMFERRVVKLESPLDTGPVVKAAGPDAP
jgi:hypothetical protein